MGKNNDWLNFEHLVKDKQIEALQPPSMYKVILNNDDYTPMEFVIDVLQKFFSYDIERATQLMLMCIIKERRFVVFLLLKWQRQKSPM